MNSPNSNPNYSTSVTTIAIPLHPKGGRLRNDTELLYALRSIQTHFRDPFEIVIVGPRLPDWIQNVHHLIHPKGLKSALATAAQAHPKGFFWFYDDCVLLRDTTADELRITPCLAQWQSSTTRWARNLERIRKRLLAEGFKPWDYSRPHGPYWFDQSMIQEAFSDWPGMKGKFPFESWILSKRDWPRRFGVVHQVYCCFSPPPGNKSILNYNDAGNTPILRKYLQGRFATASPFEKDSNLIQ